MHRQIPVKLGSEEDLRQESGGDSTARKPSLRRRSRGIQRQRTFVEELVREALHTEAEEEEKEGAHRDIRTSGDPAPSQESQIAQKFNAKSHTEYEEHRLRGGQPPQWKRW